MRLIGAGLPRTATLTQKVALEMLGVGPCYHMVDVLADLPRADTWLRAADGDAQWTQIFEGYESTVDWPGGYFYRELMDAFPEAKVLLSVRDPQSWERSARETIWSVRHGESLMRLLSSARGEVDPEWRGFLRMIDRLLWTEPGTFASSSAEPDRLAAAMTSWNEQVQRTVEPERLLVWQPGDGWEPLCEFLEVAVPDGPVPHVNDSKMFVDRVVDGALIALNEFRLRRAADAEASSTAAATGAH